MEGNKSDSVFDSMNLNPQLFINETINTMDDFVDEAFDFYGRKTSAILKIDGSDRSEKLSNGIDCVHGMVQSVLDKRMQMWEGYCVKHCFTVPEGFALPGSDDLSVYYDQNIQDGSYDLELDEQLESLRHNLNLVGKRSAELNSELQALERTSVSTELSARLVIEAFDLYDESSVDDMFNEMAKMAPKLRAGMDRLKTRRMEAIESAKEERLKNHGKEFLATTSDGKLEDLKRFLAELRKM